MIDQNILEEVKQRLIKTYNPFAIYLFGSYVWGQPHEESDLDVLIVIDKYNKDPYFTVVDGYRALGGLDISKDLFVLSLEEFNNCSEKQDHFFHEIKTQGREIYARA